MRAERVLSWVTVALICGVTVLGFRAALAWSAPVPLAANMAALGLVSALCAFVVGLALAPRFDRRLRRAVISGGLAGGYLCPLLALLVPGASPAGQAMLVASAFTAVAGWALGSARRRRSRLVTA